MEIKKWVKEHKKELAIAAAGAVVGGALGVQIANKSNTHPKSLAKALSPITNGSDKLTMAYKTNKKVILSQTPELLNDLLSNDFVKKNLNEEVTGIAVFYKK